MIGQIKQSEFLVDSKGIKALSSTLKEGAELVLKTLSSGSPVLIRHHGDCDGFCAGFILEQAMLKALHNLGEERGWQQVMRQPVRPPVYEIDSASSDAQQLTSFRFAKKSPLVIIADCGSSRNDAVGLSVLKTFGIRAIVIDHHPITLGLENENSPILINPSLHPSGEEFSSGILALEFSRFIYPLAHGTDHLAGLSGIADRISGMPLQAYLALAERSGYPKERLERLYLGLDYLISSRGDSPSLLRGLLLNEGGRQEGLLQALYPEAQAKREARLRAMRRLMIESSIGSKPFFTIELGKVMEGLGYPPPGRSVGLLYQELKKAGEIPLVMGIGSSSVIIRGELPKGLGVNSLIDALRLELPDSEIHGGGHDVAGTISFLPADKQRVLASIYKILGAKP